MRLVANRSRVVLPLGICRTRSGFTLAHTTDVRPPRARHRIFLPSTDRITGATRSRVERQADPVTLPIGPGLAVT